MTDEQRDAIVVRVDQLHKELADLDNPSVLIVVCHGGRVFTSRSGLLNELIIGLRYANALVDREIMQTTNDTVTKP